VTPAIVAALGTAAIIGMSFSGTRWIGLSSIVILSYLKPYLVFPLVLIAWIAYLQLKK
jgi:hypothetical protein